MRYLLLRAAIWLNRGENALNLTAVWGLVALAGIIIAIEVQG
jgi:hypothetical protein